MESPEDPQEELRRDGVGDVRIPAEVVIAERLSGRTYRGTLPNGKVILLFEARGVTETHRAVGDTVRVGLSLCDFSSAAILP
jgi:hypothetical protein